MARRQLSPYQRLEKKLTKLSEDALAERQRERVEAEEAALRREYAGASQKHTLYGFRGPTTSADTEIRGALTRLRGRSRQVGRDSPYAKRAKAVFRSNVVFTGIGMKAAVRGTRGELRKPLNKSIEEAFAHWWEDPQSVHTGGELCGADIENQLIDQVIEAGECFVRLHYRPFGRSEVPLALELVESERCPHELVPERGPGVRPRMRMGVEHDEFHRPTRYWLRQGHPSDEQWGFESGASERIFPVDASEIIHLRTIERWPQHRGVPWFHAVLDTLHNMRGYTESEIVAARGAANYFASLKKSDWDPDVGQDATRSDAQGNVYQTLEPGTIFTPPAGSELDFHAPNRPNSALDPFMRFMLREVSAGIGPTYESLSRDYSQHNYSSSRLALLEDRDLWRVLQMWFIRNFRRRVHQAFMRQAAVAGAIRGMTLEDWAAEPEKFEAVKFRPRGWTWVDPQKEVKAFKEAILGGLTTRTAVIAATAGGADIEDIDEERRQELEAAAGRDGQMSLRFDTDPGTPAPSPQQQQADAAEQAQRDAEDAADAQRALRLV